MKVLKVIYFPNCGFLKFFNIVIVDLAYEHGFDKLRKFQLNPIKFLIQQKL